MNSHALDLDLGGLNISVEEIRDTARNNLDDCMATAACVSSAGGCWACLSSLTSIISCGS